VTTVVAPLPGLVVGLAGVPDAVFADELVGSGTAIAPSESERSAVVVAPIAGTIGTLHPHAFVVVGADGSGILVHVGIDTVKLAGEGFGLRVAKGDDVAQGAPVVEVDLARVRAAGYSTVCPVVLLDSPAGTVDVPTGGVVAAGDPLFTV
jgi:sugar PTS system EIIA component